jgi:tripartite motif-containing protein 71
MPAGFRSGWARAALVLAAAAAVLAFAALLVSGTAGTMPREASATGGYTLRAAWDGSEIPGGPLHRPIGIAVAPSGDVYVTDARQRVVRFGASGAFLAEWGREGDGDGEFSNPVGIAVGPDGSVYVSDFEQDRIQKFTGEGVFLLAFGGPGSEAGEFDGPTGLAVDDAGAIYVADFYNHRVQRWRTDGAFDRMVGHPGRLGRGALHYPTGVAVTAGRDVLVADAYNYRLQWFDPQGAPLRRRGYHLFWVWPRPAGSTSGLFVPTGAAVDGRGAIHVADSGNHRVVMLSSDGGYITDWRVPDPNPGVYSPEHVAVSADGATVYATDLAGDRVLVLAVTRAPRP